ncbi:MAG: protein-glutamate O-methyltransferase CheR [bacterium]|nr:protein-glutamate O-methyltransferase CheR [bacterium]
MPPVHTSLSFEELALFNELFSSRFGLFFPDHKREILESRLRPRLRANHLNRFIDYYLLLQYDLKRELDPLVRAITNNESYFFRETLQFEAVSGSQARELRDGGVAGRLRILSAGCSSGEEPYSLNLFVRRAAFGPYDESLRIDAIDIDSERLEMALEATFRPNSLRTLSEAQIEQYFVRHDEDCYELRKIYRHGVHFAEGNILDLSTFRQPTPYDAVFCRNVLIYFSESGLRNAIENFARVVRPGGLLFLGHSESIIGLTKVFQAERLGQCIAYRRIGK